jgi:hypothetical protein
VCRGGRERIVSWIRWLAASLSPRRIRFDARPVHVGFMVNKVVLERDTLAVFRVFPCLYHPTDVPLSFIYRLIIKRTLNPERAREKEV